MVIVEVAAAYQGNKPLFKSRPPSWPIQETLGANVCILRDMEPMIVVSQLADSSVNIAVKPWVAIKDFGVAASEINQAILETFREAGIVIPFPQREVRMVAAA